MRADQGASYGQAQHGAQQRADQTALEPKQLTGGQRDHDDGEGAQQGERGQVARPPVVVRRRADGHPDRG